MFVVAEFPKFKCIEMRNFPRFLAEKIEFGAEWDAVNDHPSGDEWKIEFFGVVSAQKMLRLAKMIVHQIVEIGQDFLFVADERCYPESTDVAFEREVSHGEADDFPELGPDATAFVELF